MISALAIFIRRRTPGWHAPTWIDATVLGTAATLMWWIYVIAPVAAGADLSPAATATAVSVGAVSTGGGLADPEQLVRTADQALYTAKRDGRNRVRFLSGAAPLPLAVDSRDRHAAGRHTDAGMVGEQPAESGPQERDLLVDRP
jgi:hypothetical protein